MFFRKKPPPPAELTPWVRSHGAHGPCFSIVDEHHKGAFDSYMIEEPPTRRLIHYVEKKKEYFDIPIPWVYTFMRFGTTRKDEELRTSLYSCALFFSPKEIDYRRQGVFHPYIPNLHVSGEVCWGANWPYSIDGDLSIEARVAYVLNSFWQRSFNKDLSGCYYEYGMALQATYGIVMEYEPIREFLAALEHLSIAQVCSVLTDAPGGMISRFYRLDKL